LHPDLGLVQVKGKLVKAEETGVGRAKRLVAWLRDETGVLELVWFKGIKWIKPKLLVGSDYVAFGKPTRFGAKMNMAHPEIEAAAKVQTKLQVNWEPVYSSTEKLGAKGLNSKGIAKLQKVLVPQIRGKISEVLSPAVCQEFQLMGREDAFFNLHLPRDPESLKRAHEIRRAFLCSACVVSI